MIPRREILLVWVLLAPAIALAQSSPVRVSAWYWLNSAPASEWGRDFRTIRNLGFTHAVLCWGLDLAAVSLRPEDTRQALALCRRAGLGAYLVIWHPTHNSLERKPEFQQKDIAGRLRLSFDAFNSQWRGTQWKSYLQTVASVLRDEPAFAGYVFDDSFLIGPIERFGGPSGKPPERILPGGDQRAAWWEQWARETVQFIREVDANRSHEIYLEDGEYVLGRQARQAVGLDFGRVAKHFDAVGAYTAKPWDSPESGTRLARHTREILEKTREAIGPDKKIIYTFWVANQVELRKPGRSRFPTVEQIRLIADTALQFGIQHLDLYGFRIGDWAVKEEEWPQRRPGRGKTYPLTGSFPGKFLYDRSGIHDELRAYLRGLTAGGER